MPKISVVIASYNHERFVTEALQSVLGQTYQDFEVVITDDGSTDRTVETIRSCRDPRVRLFCFEENRGASAAMNHSVREAKGKYLAALASDDLCVPERLEKQVAILDRSPQIGGVFSYAQLIDEDRNDFADTSHPYYGIFKQPNRSRHEWLRHFFYHGNALCHPSLMIRRKCHEEVGYYDERLAQLLDLDMWIRLCRRYEIHIIQEDLVRYRVRVGDVSASGDRPETRIRLITEHTRILSNFLNIKSTDTLYRVFPEARKYGENLNEKLIPFVVSMLALEKESIAHRNFAISTLFELLKDQQTRDSICEVFRFLPIDFIKLTGKYDLFNVGVNNLLQQKEKQVGQLQTTIQTQEAELKSIHASLGWRLLSLVGQLRDRLLPIRTRRRKVYDIVVRSVKRIRKEGWRSYWKRCKKEAIRFYVAKTSYRKWIAKNEPGKAGLDAMRLASRSWSYRPKVSIVTPVYNPNRYDLTQCIQSVLDQTYENWELCLVDGASDRPYVKDVIKSFADREPRIKYAVLAKNQGIAGNSNEALKLAGGEYVGLLDHDDMLAPFALHEVVKLLNATPEVDYLYSDEDKVPPEGGKRYDPAFKPDWSPDTFLSGNYACHFSVVRKRILDDIGWFREGYDGSQDYDLILRIVQKTSHIRRIPNILYHWRASRASVASDPQAKPYAYVAAKKAINEYLANQGLQGEVVDGLFTGGYRVKYRVRPFQTVSIIIPTRDQVHLLKQCVASVLDKTDYQHFKVLIVDNGSREPETHEFFNAVQRDRRVNVLRDDRPFNFSAINNRAAGSADSEHLVFLNNDTEVISREWLSAMLEFAQRKDVGAVGARLYFTDRTIQHAGVILGLGGVAAHSHRDFPDSAHGYMGRIKIIQNLSAVTAACMMVRREVFEEVGGFDESLAHAFNDVDLCLKMREKGYLIVYTPYAELYHHESASRGVEDTPERRARFAKEVEIMKGRWKHVLEAGDPYYNPNLTLDKPDFSIRL